MRLPTQRVRPGLQRLIVLSPHLVDLVADRVKRCMALMPASIKSRARSSARYTRLLAELLDAASATRTSADAGPQLMGAARQALRNAIATQPRDLTLVRERVAELGTMALRLIRAIGEDEAPPGYVNPTPNRLPALIDEYAPNIPGLLIANDDPFARFGDEILRTADSYATADPQSFFGGPEERLRLLYRVAGLAARALAL
jgi:hypothetical protein